MRIYRDPLVHFLALGILLFFSYYWLNPEQGNSTIEISAETVAGLEQKWEMQWNRKPTEKELQGLVEAYTREEILSREALAMELDRGDIVIRRRLAQKVDFLLDNITEPEEPDEAILMEYYRNNPDRFRTGPFFSFYHVYLIPERHADPADPGAKLLQQLQAGKVQPRNAKHYGDPFIDGVYFNHQSANQLNRLFGQGFAESLIDLKLNEWNGPIQSGLGLHIIYPTYYKPLELPGFDEVRKEVRQFFLDESRQALKDAEYKKIEQRYRVRMIGTE